MTTAKVFDAILNATTVLAAAVILASAVLFGSARGPGARSSAAEEIPALDFDKADYTVALVVSSSCVHCAASMPAFRKMTASIGRLGRAVRCVALGTEPEPVLDSYLAVFDVPVERVYRVPVTRLSNVTPRVVLFDRKGVVLGDWIGRMETKEAQEVVATLVRQPALARTVSAERRP